MLIVLVLLVLMLPYTGIVLLYFLQEEYEWLVNGNYSLIPFMLYTVFLVAFFSAFFIRQRKPITEGTKLDVAAYSPNLRYVTFAIFVILLIVMVPFQGLWVLGGEVTKEHVRQMGPFHAFFTKYLSPSLLAYVCLWHRFHPNKESRNAVIFSIVSVLLIGAATGGKASAIQIVLPGVIALYWDRMNFWAFLRLVLISFCLVVVAGLMFDSFLEGDLFDAVLYILYRAFILTAELPYAVPLQLIDDEMQFSYLPTLMEIFGKSNIKLFVGMDEVYQYGFSMAVSAAQYPDMVSAVSSGEWNMTPNIFVEGLLFFGLYGFIVFGLIAGYFVAVVLDYIKKSVAKRRYDLGAMTITYFVFVLLSWLNSAGIVQLVHPLMLISMGVTYFILQPGMSKRGFVYVKKAA
ncbi:hypothetical protein FNU76_04800 [Chitinimonas arctica]|uniref:Oligosaccharide repeat unit polymerase n=1 Tax=Chitinimonas arctica TaxID=2594795 RepID=A0A516SC44_9NEIS|nr:hypothetical protein [Chitinimonas arctica]QDQ25722.1 hypothetical protein FNU76_04800 [Chitinimonas arctica]